MGQLRHGHVWQSMRRFMALFFLLFVVAAPAEAMIPDVHDADAGVVHVEAYSQAQTEHHRLASEHTAPPAGTGSHAFHVDHCAHSHATGMPAAGPPPAAGGVVASRLLVERRSLYENADLPRHHRPPIE